MTTPARTLTIPTPRQLLTSLFASLNQPQPRPSSLPHISAPPPRATSSSSSSTTPPARLPPSLTPQLLALHCIFPTLLLPALDLLDRGLVTKTLPTSTTAASASAATAPHLRAPSLGHPACSLPLASPVYYVTTSMRRKRRRHHHHLSHHGGNSGAGLEQGDERERGGGDAEGSAGNEARGRRYEVRVGPWQCSCAVFAMGEFGGEDGARAEVRVWEGREVGEQGRGGDAEVERRGRREEGGGRGEGREGDDCGGAGHLRFGGLAREEGQGRVPAMCKHLMACLLAESCTEIGKLVRVERLSRQERAGWAADLGG